MRRRLHDQLTSGVRGTGRLSPSNWALTAIILLSIVLALIESEPTVSTDNRAFLQAAEVAFGLIFLVEYVARLWTCVEDPRYAGWRGRLRYAVTPAAVIDLLALAPLLVGAIGSEAYVLRGFRLLRILRVAKLGRYTQAAAAVAGAIHLRRHELTVSLVTGLLLLLVSATCLYVVEGADQPDQFGSIPRAMWWAVATLTTVGYGDVFPTTPLGKLLASFTAVIGIGLIAVPTGIIASAFSQVLEKRGETTSEDVEMVQEAEGPPDRTRFDAEIDEQRRRAIKQGRPHVEINAGELHRTIGGYPRSSHRMPVCCDALRNAMQDGDMVVFEPPGGQGASLTVRYLLSRSSA